MGYNIARRASAEEFCRRVWAAVRRIPAGRVMTYGQIADHLGCPGRARAVGYAMRFSPPSVPWHRVVSSRGTISERPDRESMAEQRQRLEAEGVRFDEAGRIDLRIHLWEPPEEENGAPA
ncbi:MAG TPA: MGMT family protein [Armatimonadetes bacterium]|jgi:methylated-DNA-protein-cysteine methyltransferase-like protein|nr:MGMT family protein [Armatimonadota bacterium]